MSLKLVENDKTEFKSILNEKLERVVISFLNSKTGGDLYIGVADDGTILGVDNADKMQLAITDRLKNNISPTCLGLFDVYSEGLDGKTVIHIVVSSGTEKPYYLKSFGMSPAGCYMRIGNGVKPMEISIIDKLYASRTRNSLRNIASPRYASHSFAQLKIYYQERGYELNDAFIQNLDLYAADGKYNYVAYLLADVNSVSIKVAKYLGVDKCDLIENEEYGFCSLVKATERVLDKLEIENKTFTKITGAAKRLEHRMIDRIALREAFINAMVHNDYSREVPPLVEIYSNRLVITSYGGLIEGLSEDDFFSGRSMPRNRELMRVFRDLELVEHLGSGMHRILNAYNRSIFHLSENFIEIVFPLEMENSESENPVTDHATDHATAQDTAQVTVQVTAQVKELLLVLDSAMTTAEIMGKMQLTHREHFRQYYLLQALNMHLIEMTIPEKPNSRFQKYRLTPNGVQFRQSDSLVDNILPLKMEKFESENLNTAQVTNHVTAQVTAQVKELLLALDTAMTTAEIMQKMQLTHREYFRQSYLQQALNMQFIEMTIPEKPNSKLQKYRLTPKGMQFKNELGGRKA